MWPLLLIVGIGRRRRFPLPLPLVLLWPFLLLGWLVFGIGWLVTPRWRSAPALAGIYGSLVLCSQVRGLRVEALPRQGAGVSLRVV
jgi:hypothetical protein